MADLTAARTNFSQKDFGQVFQSWPVKAAAKIYKGSLVSLNAGFARKGTEAASEKVVGIALETVDNTDGADGDVEVKVVSGIEVELNATSIAAADRGKVVYLVDDNTVDETAGVNSVKVGILHDFISATKGTVYIPPGGMAQSL